MRRSVPDKKKSRDADNIQRLYWILGSIAALTIFIVMFVIGDYGLYQIYLLHKEKKQIENHMVELSVEQDSLSAERARLENDIQYIEKLARERYRMAKKGEKVFRIIEKSEPKTDSTL
ncbi:MAG: septum formation initiator family protein [Candidatus Neomarinimicrobiota bacterium]